MQNQRTTIGLFLIAMLVFGGLGYASIDKNEGKEEKREHEAHGEEGKVIKLSEAPESVQKSITRVVGKGKLKQVEVETEDGFTLYEVEYTNEKGEHSVKLSDKGAVIEREQALDAKKLPGSVKTLLKTKFKGAKILESEVVTLRFYEIEIEVDGKKREIKVLANGQMIEVEADDGDDDDDDDDDK